MTNIPWICLFGVSIIIFNALETIFYNAESPNKISVQNITSFNQLNFEQRSLLTHEAQKVKLNLTDCNLRECVSRANELETKSRHAERQLSTNHQRINNDENSVASHNWYLANTSDAGSEESYIALNGVSVNGIIYCTIKSNTTIKFVIEDIQKSYGSIVGLYPSEEKVTLSMSPIELKIISILGNSYVKFDDEVGLLTFAGPAGILQFVKAELVVVKLIDYIEFATNISDTELSALRPPLILTQARSDTEFDLFVISMLHKTKFIVRVISEGIELIEILRIPAVVDDEAFEVAVNVLRTAAFVDFYVYQGRIRAAITSLDLHEQLIIQFETLRRYTIWTADTKQLASAKSNHFQIPFFIIEENKSFQIYFTVVNTIKLRGGLLISNDTAIINIMNMLHTNDTLKPALTAEKLLNEFFTDILEIRKGDGVFNFIGRNGQELHLSPATKRLKIFNDSHYRRVLWISLTSDTIWRIETSEHDLQTLNDMIEVKVIYAPDGKLFIAFRLLGITYIVLTPNSSGYTMSEARWASLNKVITEGDSRLHNAFKNYNSVNVKSDSIQLISSISAPLVLYKTVGFSRSNQRHSSVASHDIFGIYNPGQLEKFKFQTTPDILVIQNYRSVFFSLGDTKVEIELADGVTEAPSTSTSNSYSITTASASHQRNPYEHSVKAITSIALDSSDIIEKTFANMLGQLIAFEKTDSDDIWMTFAEVPASSVLTPAFTTTGQTAYNSDANSNPLTTSSDLIWPALKSNLKTPTAPGDLIIGETTDIMKFKTESITASSQLKKIPSEDSTTLPGTLLKVPKPERVDPLSASNIFNSTILPSRDTCMHPLELIVDSYTLYGSPIDFYENSQRVIVALTYITEAWLTRIEIKVCGTINFNLNASGIPIRSSIRNTLGPSYCAPIQNKLLDVTATLISVKLTPEIITMISSEGYEMSFGEIRRYTLRNSKLTGPFRHAVIDPDRISDVLTLQRVPSNNPEVELSLATLELFNTYTFKLINKTIAGVIKASDVRLTKFSLSKVLKPIPSTITKHLNAAYGLKDLESVVLLFLHALSGAIYSQNRCNIELVSAYGILDFASTERYPVSPWVAHIPRHGMKYGYIKDVYLSLYVTPAASNELDMRGVLTVFNTYSFIIVPAGKLLVIREIRKTTILQLSALEQTIEMIFLRRLAATSFISPNSDYTIQIFWSLLTSIRFRQLNDENRNSFYGSNWAFVSLKHDNNIILSETPLRLIVSGEPSSRKKTFTAGTDLILIGDQEFMIPISDMVMPDTIGVDEHQKLDLFPGPYEVISTLGIAHTNKGGTIVPEALAKARSVTFSDGDVEFETSDGLVVKFRNTDT